VESLLFAGIAFVILVPIIYFLPLGFSLRGKVFIIAAAFLISLVGLLAAPIMPFWQTLLIEILLIGVTAYFMFKRIETILQVPAEDMEQETYQQLEQSTFESLNDTYSHIAISENWANDLIEEEPGLLQKAMRQAGEPKFSILIGNHEGNTVSKTNDLPMDAFAQVAVSKEETPRDMDSQENESKPDGEFDDTSVEVFALNEVEAEKEETKVDELEETNYGHTTVQYIEQHETEPSYLAEMEDLLNIEEESLPEVSPVSQADLEEVDFDDEIAVSHTEEPTPNLSDYDLDELSELDFDEIPMEKEAPESQLDEAFWNSLLEDDELEVLEEKKEYSSIK
jgi:hypothetical protein